MNVFCSISSVCSALWIIIAYRFHILRVYKRDSITELDLEGFGEYILQIINNFSCQIKKWMYKEKL